jgi:hypothetical protein
MNPAHEDPNFLPYLKNVEFNHGFEYRNLIQLSIVLKISILSRQCNIRGRAFLPYLNIEIIIVLINGCFHNGPVICPKICNNGPRSLYWPEAMPRDNALTWRAIITDRGHITGPLWKHPFLNTCTFINQLKPLCMYASPGVRKLYFQNLSPVKY